MISHNFLEFGDTLQNPFVQKWVAENKKVIGYYCSNMPEELVHAAGFLPFRIRGTGNTDFILSDAILSRFNCTFARSTLNLALKGEYNFLDGLIVANTCDHIRRMFDIWQKKVEKVKKGDLKLFFLSLPHVFSEDGWKWVNDELNLFRTKFAESFNVKITQESLLNSLQVYNKNSELMGKVSNFRSLDIPRLSGTDFFKISIANSAVRKEYANSQLEQIIKELETNNAHQIKNPRARLLLIGSMVDNAGLISILEHAGALIVADTLCTGVRSYLDDKMWIPSEEFLSKNDPMDKILQKVYLRVFCPRMMNGHQQRLRFIKEQIKAAKIDGIIIQRMEFCDLHGCENSLYEHIFEEELNIPAINLDREYFLGDTGRLRTRVEAFLEKIGGKK